MFKKKERKVSMELIPKSIINIAWILVAGGIMPMLDATMVNIAVKHLSSDFNASLSLIQWVITGYVLATGIAVPIAGWLVQRFNGKWIFFGANLLFILASFLSGISWNIESLIIFRVIQGISAGLIIPILTTLLVEVAGQERMGRVMSIVGVPIVLGPILGPVIGAVLVQYFSWRFIFFVNLPFGVLATILIALKLPDFNPSTKKSKLDLLGIILLGLSSSTIIYAIVEASKKASLTNTTSLKFGILGIVILIGYIVYAAIRKEKAIVPLALFKTRSFKSVMIGLFLAGIATNGPMLLFPLFFQTVRHFSVISAGLILIPQGIGMLIARPVIGKSIDNLGAKPVVILSLIITLLGTFPFMYFDKASSLFIIIVTFLIRGIGIGGITIPLMSDAYTGMERSAIAQASIATRIIQNIGGAFGSAILATILSSSINSTNPTIAHYTTAYHNGFFASLIVSLIIFIPALFLTSKKTR